MYVSIRDAMVAGGEFSTPAAGLKHLGVSAVEIELRGDFSVLAMDATEWVVLSSGEDAAAHRKHLAGLDIEPCCFLTACDWSAGSQEQNVRWVARAIEFADILGMPSIRIDSAMTRERELPFGERVTIFADGLSAALERTTGSKVALGIENHGYQGNNLAFLLNVFQRVNSPRLGVTLDTGNFYWRGYPLSEVYGILKILAPYAKHTHLKNIRYPECVREDIREAGWKYGVYVAPLDEGDIEHAHVVQLLSEAGYAGDLCIEDESLGHYDTPEARVAVLERDVAHVRGLLAGRS